MEDWQIAVIVSCICGVVVFVVGALLCWKYKKCRPCNKEDVEIQNQTQTDVTEASQAESGSKIAGRDNAAFETSSVNIVAAVEVQNEVKVEAKELERRTILQAIRGARKQHRQTQQEQQLLEQQQRLEKQRLELQWLEQQRLEQQRLEQQRLEQQRLEQQRLEQQRLEQWGLEQHILEQNRLEQERIQQQWLQQQLQDLWIDDYDEEDEYREKEDDGNDDYTVQDRKRGRSRQRNRDKSRHRSESGDFSRQREATDPNKTIDLHYLSVGDAMNQFVQFLKSAENEYHRSNYRKIHRFVHVITGRGLHSKNRIPKIKPAVQRYLDKHDYNQEWKNSGGLVTIDLLSRRRNFM